MMQKEALNGRARTLALIVVAAALVMDILDLTIVNVAIPTLQATFGANDAAVQWIVAGYATIFAILLVTGGRLGDIFGYKRLLLVGMAGFTVASLLCGIAQTPAQLVAARLFQGATAALMLPQVMSLVQIMYPPRERISALSVFGVLGGIAAVSGPVLGGLIIGADLFGWGWRPIFLINVPIGLINIIAAVRLLPDSRSTHATRLDLIGTILVTATLFAIMFPLIQGRQLGWPAWVFALMTAAIPLGGLSLIHSCRRMRRDGSALIVPDLFKLRAFNIGLAMTAFFQVSVGGMLFTLSLALQNGLGFTAAEAGLTHVPYALGSAIGIGFLSRKILPRFGSRILAWGAMLMLAGLAALLIQLGFAQPTALDPLALAPAIFAMGLGMGLLAGPLAPVTLSEVDVRYAGAASGVFKAVQELGSAIGVAIIGTLFFVVTADGGAAGALRGFETSGLVIGAGLSIVIVLTLFLPDTLRILSANPPERKAELEVGG